MQERLVLRTGAPTTGRIRASGRLLCTIVHQTLPQAPILPVKAKALGMSSGRRALACLPQPLVDPSGPAELIVRTALGHPATRQHYDLVQMVQALQVVGDQQQAPA